MRVHHLIATWVLLAAGTAAAEPDYSRKLDELTLDRARTELISLAAQENIEAKTAELLLKLDVFATSNDTGCPGVDVDVVNATPRVVWGIEVKIKQKETTERTDVIHLPYMMPNTKVRVSVACLQDYKARYDYSPTGGISVSYEAKGEKTLDAALATMVTQKADYSNTGYSLEPVTLGTKTLLETALAMNDADVAHDLVLAIARTGIGSRELGDAITANGTGAIADEVATSMSKLPPAQQAGLARSLLASTVAERWKDKLLPMIDSRLCAGNRADAVGLWIQSTQGNVGIPSAALRDRVREKCKPSKSDGPGLIGALEKDPSKAGGVLDAVDPDLFASAIAAWRTKKTEMPKGLVAYLRDGQDAARFDQAVTAIPALGLPTALSEIVKTPELPGAKHKAEWALASLTKIAEIDDAVRELTQELVEGSIPSEAMRDVARTIGTKAPKVTEEVLVTYAGAHSLVFDASKLSEKHVDLGEFLAFNSSKLGDCTATFDVLRGCARAIAAFKERPGTGSLQKAAKDAVRDDFMTKAKDLVSATRDHGELVSLAQDMAAAGFSVDFVVDQVCGDAENAIRYDNDPDDALAAVAKIDANAHCISSTKDAIASKKRKAVLFTIFAIVGLVGPLPVGGWFMRRRFRKLQKELPAIEEEKLTGVKLDDRLGAHGLGVELRKGLGEASRELAGTPAQRSLDTIDDATLFAALDTVKRAVKTGDAASLIIRRPSDAVYIVGLPVKHPRPQLVQRYLNAPWPDHLQSIQRAAGLPVLAVIVLCGPDATEATLLISYSDGATVSDPEGLLDAKDARDRGANRFRYVMTLAQSTPAATPAAAAA